MKRYLLFLIVLLSFCFNWNKVEAKSTISREEKGYAGLDYNRFRYYSPETGMYISQDPIGIEGNNPNLYAYVSDSNRMVDLLGLQVTNASLYGIPNASSSAQGALLNEYYRTAESANDVVNSLKTTGQLPSNYYTKLRARAKGWKPGKSVGNSIPNGQIGGDIFQNLDRKLPHVKGRVWYEADIGLSSTMTRAKQAGTRLLYSSDGLTYITSDHYKSFQELGRWFCPG